ncbi:MAG: excisionase family DNA-binding protein [Phycisphaerales bacterium]|nr:excisionase family DNA-binding protein [Phycisphaerales bacterium]
MARIRTTASSISSPQTWAIAGWLYEWWQDVDVVTDRSNLEASDLVREAADDVSAANSARTFMSISECCDATGLSVSTVRRLIKRGHLEMFQPGGHRCRILIPVSAIQSLQDQAVSKNDGPEILPHQSPSPRLPGPQPQWRDCRFSAARSTREKN